MAALSTFFVNALARLDGNGEARRGIEAFLNLHHELAGDLSPNLRLLQAGLTFSG